MAPRNTVSRRHLAAQVPHGFQAPISQSSLVTWSQLTTPFPSSLPVHVSAIPNLSTSSLSDPSKATSSSSPRTEADSLGGILQEVLECIEPSQSNPGDRSYGRLTFTLASIQRASTAFFSTAADWCLSLRNYNEHEDSHTGPHKQKSAEDFWTSGTSDSKYWSEDEKFLRGIPQYILDYAPFVHLFDKEEYWPSDIADHLINTTPYLNYTPIEAKWQHPNLTDLDKLNEWGPYVYLHSNDDVSTKPEWLTSRKNIPVEEHAGRSDAPAVLVVINKPGGIVDAFWFFFYSFNLGNAVFNVRFGNHVGDWEHMLVRFKRGKPIQIFYSEHSWGKAYTYKAVEKIGKRPVGYSASGTHAMYAKAGVHKYVLPLGLLHDETSRGPLWDPLLNSHAYTFDLGNETLRASNFSPKAPIQWFDYGGRWGDRTYPLSDPRQRFFYGNYHYVSGPTGPKFKGLRRKNVCQGGGPCKVRNWIGEEDSIEWLDDGKWLGNLHDQEPPDALKRPSGTWEGEL